MKELPGMALRIVNPVPISAFVAVIPVPGNLLFTFCGLHGHAETLD